jgi:hypothetical protein
MDYFSGRNLVVLNLTQTARIRTQRFPYAPDRAGAAPGGAGKSAVFLSNRSSKCT